MLARVAENVYWLARYLERAENLARLVLVNTNLLLDLPPDFAPGWLPLIDITADRVTFDARYTKADERSVVSFLVADRDNPGSLLSSLAGARDNMRQLREMLPSALWEQLNQFYLSFSESLPATAGKRATFEQLHSVVLAVQTLTGIIEGALSRDDAYTFVCIARALERADMTSRIVDVRSALLLPASTPELAPFEQVQWMSVLKSLSAYQMYRLKLRTRVNRGGVLEFLLRDAAFPRSFLYCVRAAEQSLRPLPGSRPTLDALSRLRRFLKAVPLETLSQQEIHELIDRLQSGLSRAHERIALSYFRSPDATPPESALQAGNQVPDANP